MSPDRPPRPGDPPRDVSRDLEETRSAGLGDGPRAREWGGLQLLAEIGSGGFGHVYRARDPALARDVALKVISLRSPSDAALVLREGQMLARVRHRNVVTVHAASRIGDEVGLTMELIEGQNLADIIRQHGPMGPEEAAVIGLSVCQALAAVHAVALVHRDVKARNVMRERGGRIVLMDFGLGREVQDRLTSDLSGTPPYIAPELFAGGQASPASDLYSLGVLLFFLVTRQYPMADTTLPALAMAHAAGERQLLSDVRPDLPHDFVRAVERALAPDPERRYRTAGAMIQALASAIPDVSTPAVQAAIAGSAGAVAVAPPSDRVIEHVNRGTRITAWVAATAGATLGIGLLGMLTSAAFNLTLGRRGGFSDDTLLDWWEYGARSLVTPVVYGVLTLGAALAGRACWRILRPAARPLVERSERLLREASSRIGLADPSAAAQWLLVAQGAALVVIVWQFSDLLRAIFTFVEVAEPGTLAVLSDSSPAPVLYRRALSITLSLAVVAWDRLLKRPSAAQSVDRATRAGALALVVITVLLLEVPYRLSFHNNRPVVEHTGQRCYEFGRQSDERLVYCQAWEPPRVRVVPAGAVRETGQVASPFAGSLR